MHSKFNKKQILVLVLSVVIFLLGSITVISLKYKGYFTTASSNTDARHFKVESIIPEVYGTEASIRISCTQEIDLDKIKGYVEVKPKTNFIIEQAYLGIVLRGDFKAGSTYDIEVLKGMPSATNVAITKTIKKTIIIPDYEPTVNFQDSGMYMSFTGKQNIPLDLMNVDAIKVKALKVYDNNIVYLINNMGSYRSLENIGVETIEKKIRINAELNKSSKYLLNVRDILTKDANGIYFFTINGEKMPVWRETSKLVLITDLGMVAKKSNTDLLVWLNSLATNKAIAGATVKVYSKTNQQILEGITDSKGVVHFQNVHWDGDKKPFVITATLGNDVSFLEFEKSILSEVDFNIKGMPYLSTGYESFLYTDRGIYRPGDKIHLRAIVRGMHATLPAEFPILLEVVRPDGKLMNKTSAILSKFGSADLEIELPDYAVTGRYTAKILIPGNNKDPIGQTIFNIEEFMPDRLNVTINVPETRFNTTETIPVNIKTEQAFGIAAEGRRIDVTCVLRTAAFKPAGFEDYSFTDATNTFTSETINLGEKNSDLTGNADFNITLPQAVKPASALVSEINAVVKEIGGRAVTARTERFVDPYPYYIGIKQVKEGYATINQTTRFKYVVLAANGKQLPTPALVVDVYKIVWNNVLKKDAEGELKYIAESREELVLQDVIKEGDTSQEFSFIPKMWGDYVIKIHGTDEQTHTASLAFYSSESGYMPWAMERPDRLDLKFDKTSYEIGETAKLTIKSPFKGKAIITLSKDRIINTEIIELTHEIQEVPITITEKLAPNVYCAVTVIRPVRAKQGLHSYRAYGIIPLQLDSTKHKLMVNIQAPLVTLPKQKLKVIVNVKHGDGIPANAELAMALVDDGILSLTKFILPDPFKFFYEQRANNIATSDIYSLIMPEFDSKPITADSVPSGDSSAAMLSDVRRNSYNKHLNPVNAKRVKPISMWQGNVVTDIAGNAAVEFNIPAFTGNLKLMAVAISGPNFGSQQLDMKVIAPLIVNSNLPRILATNDEFVVPISLFNTTEKSMDVSIDMETSTGFTILAKPEIIKLPAGKEVMVSFKLKAPAIPGKADIRIKAITTGHAATEDIIELAVRPPLPFTVLNGSGVIHAATEQVMKMPFNWLADTGTLNLTITPLPALQFAGGLKFLLRYPYGCVEQVVSKTFPLLYLKDIADLVMQDPRYSQTVMDNYINAGIEQLLAMQTHDGGFSVWPGANTVYPWGSIYATDFLVEAEKAGYIVPLAAKNIALDYCEKILAGTSNEHKAYSTLVLAKAGRLQSSWIRRIEELKDTLPGYAKFQLAASLYLLGDKSAVATILGQGFAEQKLTRKVDDGLNSYVRDNAIALSIYLDIDPANPMVPVLVKRLQASMQNGAWDTTQENAAALVALGKYASFIKQQDSKYIGHVLADGKVIAEFNEQSSVALDKSELVGKEIKVKIQGKGQAYYYWSSEGVPTVHRVEEKHKGIKAMRTLFSKTGQSLDLKNIKQGDAIVVDIAIKTEATHKNIVIEDILPAGFEIENPRIATSETLDWIKTGIFEPQHVDIRDDRLLIFTDLPPGQEVHYRYIVRAVTAGKFFLPALSVSCMYDPSIVSVSSQGEIEVGI